MPDYLRVTNFEKYQQYTDGRPLRWIKLHLALLDDYTFCSLPDSLKWPFVGMLLLAGRHENRIPSDAKFLSLKLSCKSVDIKALVETGMISYDSVRDSTISAPREEKSREEERRVEKRREETDKSAAEAASVRLGQFGNVVLSAEDRAKLEKRFQGRSASYIEQLDEVLEAKPALKRKFKSHYATILNWERNGYFNGNGVREKTREERLAEMEARGL